MPIRRFGRPGLLGLAARTAVVAGTASAVAGGIDNSRRRRNQADLEQQHYETAQQQAQQDFARQADPEPVAASGATGGDTRATQDPPSGIAEQLSELSSLFQSGVLTPDEFAAAKTKLLA
ncbi:SHOCT domain-containing protein [Leucobacter sp. Psy1]|uniref:SHOCT domain-containing protein n=1 Tax=Leucobacter sp. Psy1 TaxID=2875729 RepID=UPI001CD77DCB|nr:SHOCT domain-containing protein [Leucobacter sp. Psy1]